MCLKPDFFILIILLFPLVSKAQTNTKINNPYSIYGIGELQDDNPVRNTGMAGTGIAMPNSQYLNFQNPALLSRIKFISHRVEKGETVSSIAKTYSLNEEEIRRVNHNLVAEVKEEQIIRIPVRKYTFYTVGLTGGLSKLHGPTGSLKDKNVGFKYFVFGIPISQRITLAGGLKPFSMVGYNTSAKDTINQSIVGQTGNQWWGGLYQTFLASGFDLTKHLSVGLQTTFLFGRIAYNHYFKNEVYGSPYYLSKLTYSDSIFYSGLIFKPAFFYNGTIKQKGDTTLVLGIGGSYEWNPGFFRSSDKSIDSLAPYDGHYWQQPTGRSVSHPLFPNKVSLGVSLTNSHSWQFGVDFSYSFWQHSGLSSDTIASTSATHIPVRNSYRVSVGTEKILTLGRKRNTPLVKRPAIRAGAAYKKLPYIISGQVINDYSFSIGASVPMGRMRQDKHMPLTRISFAVTAGMQGNKALEPGQYIYLKFNLGIILTDKWFTRKKIY